MPEYMSNPEVERLVRQGYEAFERGVASSGSPFPPSFENFWWSRGWEAAAISNVCGAPSR